MSLITDALRAAQREKMKRQGVSPPAAAVLGFFPVKNTRHRGGSVTVWLLSAITAAVLGTSVAFFVRSSADTIPAVGPSRAIRPSVAGRADTTLPRRIASAPSARPSAVSSKSAGAAVTPTDPRRSADIRDSLLSAMRSLGPPPAPLPLLQRFAVIPQARIPASSRMTRPQSSSLSISTEPPGGHDAMRYFELGISAHNAGDLVSARRYYEQSIALDGNVANVHNNLGAVFSATGDAARAIGEFRRAVSLDPANAAAWTNLGAALRAQGRSDDAVAAFQHAMSLDAANVEAKVGLAQQYIALGALPEARALLEGVVARNPAAVEAHYSLALLLEQSGDRAGAVREYRAFLTLADPRYATYADRVRRHVEALDASR
jgi:Tfp pilus assembly protein PilF